MATDHPGHPGQTHLPRPWVRNDLARQIRDLATKNDHTISEEMRVALRSHLRRNGYTVNGGSTLAEDDEGGADHAPFGTPARGGAARDVCEPA